jgi:hypothetical protein
VVKEEEDNNGGETTSLSVVGGKKLPLEASLQLEEKTELFSGDRLKLELGSSFKLCRLLLLLSLLSSFISSLTCTCIRFSYGDGIKFLEKKEGAKGDNKDSEEEEIRLKKGREFSK